MPQPVFWALLAWNVAVGAVFGWDKLMARTGRRRVPEATLLWSTFLCGCVGAWLAMEFLRHKTQKRGFRWRALALTVMNPLWPLLWWLLWTPQA